MSDSVPNYQRKTTSTPKIRAGEFSQLNRERRRAIQEETALELMTAFAQHGYTEYSDLDQMLRDSHAPEMYVRREDPDTVLESIVQDSPLRISFPNNNRYSNSVEWHVSQGIQGMKNAFVEGHGLKNGISVIIGVPRNSIKDVVKLDDSIPSFYGLERTLVRSIQGAIRPEEIRLIIVRVPIHAFPEEFMTEPEKERVEDEERNQFILRGFIRKPH